MTDDRSKALVPQGPTSLSPLSRLAERTLAERVEREERALVATRTLLVGPGGYATISAAVEAARDGDTVLVRPGRYKESVVVEGKTITIRGDGDRDAIVVGWDKGPAFTLVETCSTLTTLTIVGGNPDPASDGFASIVVAGGAPQLDRLRVRDGRCIVFAGGAAGAVEHSEIYHNNGGILMYGGASPRIEGNEIWANAEFGMAISDAGTDPLVRANRVHDGRGPGFLVSDGASPRIEQNEFWANAKIGIGIRGAETDPLVRANQIHDGKGSGIFVSDKASPRIEQNEVWANAAFGMAIFDAGTNPLIQANRVHDGRGPGLLVSEGASPTITGNTITGNARGAILVDGGADPKIGRNVVGD